METMIMDSNDSAASSLYSKFGWVSLIAAALTRHQLTESGRPVNPRYWGNTMVIAHDIATLYNNILEGSSISPADRDYLVSLMARMAPVATDGSANSSVWGVWTPGLRRPSSRAGCAARPESATCTAPRSSVPTTGT